MELTSEQKHDISIELSASDIYETVPFLNKVLAAIGYVDRLDDDSEREELRWTKRKEPLIKDKKIRKAVRAWAEANNAEKVAIQNNYCLSTEDDEDVEIVFATPVFDGIDDDDFYTIAELCGEEEK